MVKTSSGEKGDSLFPSCSMPTVILKLCALTSNLNLTLPFSALAFPFLLSHMHSTSKFAELFYCLLTQLIGTTVCELGRVGSMPIVQTRTQNTSSERPRCLPASTPFLRPAHLEKCSISCIAWNHLRPASLPKQLSLRLISSQQISV